MGHLLQWSLLALSIISPALSKPLAAYSFAPLVLADHHHRTDIDNSYIVLLKDDLPTDVKEDHMNFLLSALADDPFVGDHLAGISHVYNGHITGYSGRFTERVIEQIKKMTEVKFVEKDQIVYVQEVQRSAPWVSSSLNIDRSSLNHMCLNRVSLVSVIAGQLPPPPRYTNMIRMADRVLTSTSSILVSTSTTWNLKVVRGGGRPFPKAEESTASTATIMVTELMSLAPSLHANTASQRKLILLPSKSLGRTGVAHCPMSSMVSFGPWMQPKQPVAEPTTRVPSLT